MSSSLYIHVPFCLSRCRYCAFYSGEALARLGGYAELLRTEIAVRCRTGLFPGPVDTVYFGGGTPSLLEPGAVAAILAAVDRAWGIARGAEVSLEVNPVPGPDFDGLRAAGVTRLSVGVQSLDDSLLSFLGRGHTARDAVRCVAAAAKAGVESLGVDLLYGLPQTDARTLDRSLSVLVDLGASHVSAYCLELHPGTLLAGTPGFPVPEEEEQSQWEALEAAARRRGLEGYEISNFALPGFQCRHSLAYWSGDPYLGLGPGAHGFAPHIGAWGERSWNAPDLCSYRVGLAEGRLPPGGNERLQQPEALLEALFLALRQARPVDTRRLRRSFRLDPSAVERCFAMLGSQGYAREVERHVWAPTRDGMRRADGLAAWIHDRLVAEPTP